MTKIQGELEIDSERGVVYFHNKATGTSVLRICRIDPKKLHRLEQMLNYGKLGIAMLDITQPERVTVD